MMRKPGKPLLLVAALAACLSSLAYLILFRDREAVFPLGHVVLEVEWGKVQRVSIDFNRDGLVDSRGEYYQPISDPSFDDPLYRRWESSRCDGFFDIYIQYDLEGDIGTVKFDNDRDGKFDIEKSNKEGEILLKEVVRESCASWYPDE